MANLETRSQLRAICPCCFGQWAVKGEWIVDHGYTIRGYGFRNGSCYGAGKPHFGTEAGREVAARIAEEIDTVIDGLEKRAADVEARRAPVYDYRGIVVEAPTRYQIDAFVHAIEYEIRANRRAASTIRERLADWKPAEPVEVKLEKTGPAVHFRAKVYGVLGKMCAGSARETFFHLTDDRSKVTCSRCLSRLAKRDAKTAEVVK